MNIPTTLKHKPVIVCEDYAKIDGRLTENTDVQGLSLGLAQWNDRGRLDISAKVWRYTGEKWSRQSEELPIHRVLDLAMLICKAKSYFSNAYRFKKLYDENAKSIDNIDVQGARAAVKVCTENERIDEDINLFYNALVRDDEFISERLHLLANTLYEAGYGRNIRE